ncbi:MAG: flagellar motor protein MotA [Inquilinaceae bacterium]
MSRPKRYLTRMTLFVIAVLVVAAVLLPGLSGAFMANPALNGVILALTIVGIAFTFRSVLTLRPEVEWLERFQAQRSGGRPIAVSDSAEPQLLAPMAKMLGERQGRLSISPIALRSLLDGIAARLGETREISRYLIGLLVFLGLLGTFWGLLKTIGAVGDVIGNLSVEQGDLSLVFSDLKSGLEAPLSGMGTAFSSSLFGLGGSLALGFLELQASQAQNRFYNELEDWLAGATRLGSAGIATEGGEQSVPAYIQALVEQTAENLDTLQRTLSQGEENRRQANVGVLQLVDKLGILTDQMRTEQNLLVRLAESQMELKPVLTRLSDAAAASSGFGIDDATRQHIRSLDIHINRLVEDLPAAREQTVGEIRNEIKLLARTIAALAEEAEG